MCANLSFDVRVPDEEKKGEYWGGSFWGFSLKSLWACIKEAQ